MMLGCKIFRDGKFWAAEIPALDVSTQGYSLEEAREMVVDLIQTMADDPSLGVTVIHDEGENYLIDIDDTRALVRLLLSAARQHSNKSIRELARALNMRSHNAYARYERGETMPLADKFLDLLRAIREISAGRDLVLK